MIIKLVRMIMETSENNINGQCLVDTFSCVRAIAELAHQQPGLPSIAVLL